MISPELNCSGLVWSGLVWSGGHISPLYNTQGNSVEAFMSSWVQATVSSVWMWCQHKKLHVFPLNCAVSLEERHAAFLLLNVFNNDNLFSRGNYLIYTHTIHFQFKWFDTISYHNQDLLFTWHLRIRLLQTCRLLKCTLHSFMSCDDIHHVMIKTDCQQTQTVLTTLGIMMIKYLFIFIILLLYSGYTWIFIMKYELYHAQRNISNT